MTNKSIVVFNLITCKEVKIRRFYNRVNFSLKNSVVVFPKFLANKILKLIHRKNYSLVKKLIDIYEDEIITNF